MNIQHGYHASPLVHTPFCQPSRSSGWTSPPAASLLQPLAGCRLSGPICCIWNRCVKCELVNQWMCAALLSVLPYFATFSWISSPGLERYSTKNDYMQENARRRIRGYYRTVSLEYYYASLYSSNKVRDGHSIDNPQQPKKKKPVDVIAIWHFGTLNDFPK